MVVQCSIALLIQKQPSTYLVLALLGVGNWFLASLEETKIRQIITQM